MNLKLVERIVADALAEDIGTGDLTTEATVPADATTAAIIHTKADGVIAGLDVARIVFQTLDPQIVFEAKVADGDFVPAGTTIATVAGNARAILMGERVALNLLQRMGGIATMTRRAVEAVKFFPTRIVDTRKTVPGLRMLDKYAVRMGGGKNHRVGLYDAVLIKDNHIRVAGGIGAAVAAARKAIPFTAKVEVETESIEQVEQALAAGADIIMLDNMDYETMRKAVELIGGRAQVEASGKVTVETVTEVAKTGVDFISMGALTHSVKALDISLDIEAIKVSSRE
ncbi:MAG: carboxylating nicotinate-nucleotide diphosphorylase [Chloroflexota bacterium]